VRTLLNEALYVAALRRLRAFDVIHVFSASYWSFVLAPLPAIVLARALGKRVILNYRSGEADDHLGRWGRLVHPWLRLVDEIVVPSVYLQTIFASFGYRARVIQNVVDTRHFRYRERRALAPRLLSNRNFEPHYRVEDTLEAFRLVHARYPRATLTVAGTGSEDERLRRLAAEIAPAAIRFVGRVEPAGMPQLLDEADVYVNASVIDNQPVSVLEAFAAGLPVVSTPTGDIPEMLGHGTRGVLVPPRSPEALAKAVMRLLEGGAAHLPMVRRARREVERYSWPHVREAWARAYAGATPRRATASPGRVRALGGVGGHVGPPHDKFVMRARPASAAAASRTRARRRSRAWPRGRPGSRTPPRGPRRRRRAWRTAPRRVPAPREPRRAPRRRPAARAIPSRRAR
jgi:glycosyltransferase involved in cell wall biosynthesis